MPPARRRGPPPARTRLSPTGAGPVDGQGRRRLRWPPACRPRDHQIAARDPGRDELRLASVHGKGHRELVVDPPEGAAAVRPADTQDFRGGNDDRDLVAAGEDHIDAVTGFELTIDGSSRIDGNAHCALSGRSGRGPPRTAVPQLTRRDWGPPE